MHVPNNGEWFTLQRIDDRLRVIDARLRLNLEALLALHAADGHQFTQRALLALAQKRIYSASAILRRGRQFGLVHGEQLTRAHEPAPVHHHIRDIGGLAHINKLGVDCIRIAPEGGCVVQLVQIQQRKVGALARLERAGYISHVQRARAHDCGHFKSLTRGHHGRVARRPFGQ